MKKFIGDLIGPFSLLFLSVITYTYGETSDAAIFFVGSLVLAQMRGIL